MAAPARTAGEHAHAGQDLPQARVRLALLFDRGEELAILKLDAVHRDVDLVLLHEKVDAARVAVHDLILVIDELGEVQFRVLAGEAVGRGLKVLEQLRRV